MDCQFELRLQSHASVFTDEIMGIQTAFNYVSENPLGEYIILTDSLSSLMVLESIKISCNTLPCILQCKQIYYDLQNSGHDITLSWVLAHAGILGNEIADEMAKKACFSENLSNDPTLPNEIKKLAKQKMKQNWKFKWENSGDKERYANSIFPAVSTKPWFLGIAEDRGFVANNYWAHINQISS
jgi:RNase H